nr:hypothetical protein [Candidatus Liberibacter asiaticus]
IFLHYFLFLTHYFKRKIKIFNHYHNIYKGNSNGNLVVKAKNLSEMKIDCFWFFNPFLREKEKNNSNV